MTRADVGIIGGGPAGAAAAIQLASRGLAVAVIEKSPFATPRSGEMLPPEAVACLSHLGVLDSFLLDSVLMDGHLPVWGVASRWAGSDQVTADFIFNPFGNGWHLNRPRFDRMLLDRAVQTGARVFAGARILSCLRDRKSGWRLSLRDGEAERELTAPFLIDATGRGAWLARQQGIPRWTLDRLTAISLEWPREEWSREEWPRETPAVPFTAVEAVADGWWYKADLPGTASLAAFMTDADLAGTNRDNVREFWRRKWRETDLAGEQALPADSAGRIRIVSASSGRLVRVCGCDWAAVGDAALSRDPLSAGGIVWALNSGIWAADALISRAHDTGLGLARYQSQVDDESIRYLDQRNYFYGRERRWPDSVFWQRRRQQEDAQTAT